MELTNSKRLLYSARHVTSWLTEAEQQHFSDRNAGRSRRSIWGANTRRRDMDLAYTTFRFKRRPGRRFRATGQTFRNLPLSATVRDRCAAKVRPGLWRSRAG